MLEIKDIIVEYSKKPKFVEHKKKKRRGGGQWGEVTHNVTTFPSGKL